jgi:hypothetical protein
MKDLVFRKARRATAQGLRWANPGNEVGTCAAQRSLHRWAEFLKLSWNVESKEGLWTNPHVPDRVLCRLRWADRWLFDEENIWEFWVRGAQFLQIPARQDLRTMTIIILNRLISKFFARSVGSEIRLSGCWIRMLLSIAMSHIRKNDTFDNLVVWNII